MKILTAIFLGFLPGIIWLIYFYYKDKRPEPKKLVISLFLFGFLGIIPAAIIEIGAENFFPVLKKEVPVIILISSFLVIGLTEEIIKFLILIGRTFKKTVFDEMIDGIIYGVAVGFGFASSENILAIWKIGEEIILARALSATLLHGLATGIVGYYLSVYKFRNKNKVVILAGISFAVLFHGAYNLIVASVSIRSVWVLALFMFLIYFFLFLKIRRAKYVDGLQLTARKN